MGVYVTRKESVMVSLTEPETIRLLKVAIPESLARTSPPETKVAVVPDIDAETEMFLWSPAVMALPKASRTMTVKFRPVFPD
jgi:hypothetical protein